MLVRAAFLWILGLVMLVPWATYHLLFQAPRDQYALLITLILFWVFGYWSVAAPLLMLLKVRSVFRTLERVGSSQQLEVALRSPETRDVAIDLIATENGIPRFLAARVYVLLLDRLPPQSTAAAARVSKP